MGGGVDESRKATHFINSRLENILLFEYCIFPPSSTSSNYPRRVASTWAAIPSAIKKTKSDAATCKGKSRVDSSGVKSAVTEGDYARFSIRKKIRSSRN